MKLWEYVERPLGHSLTKFHEFTPNVKEATMICVNLRIFIKYKFKS